MFARFFSTLAVFCLCFNSHAQAQEKRWSKLIERMEKVSEEALGGDWKELDKELFAARDCEYTASEVQEFDSHLELTPSEKTTASKMHAPWGLPVAQAGFDAERFVHHREYIIRHSGAFKIPVFATYRLQQSDIRSRTNKKCFRSDSRLPSNESAQLPDYEEPVFDRGHLVPRADMNRSEAVMVNTYVLSNMMPQHDRFNRGIWKNLEKVVRVWAEDHGTIYILTGPIFDGDSDQNRDDPADVDRVKPRNNLGLPTHFFKIVVYVRDSGFIDAIAVRLPHKDDLFPQGTPMEDKLEFIEKNITSIDEIEAVTGYDFFPNMPQAQQVAVERAIASGLWE